MENLMKKYLLLGLLLTLVTGSFIKTAQETDNITEEHALTVEQHVQPASSLPRKLLKFTVKLGGATAKLAVKNYILTMIPLIAHEFGHAIPSRITQQPCEIFLSLNPFNGHFTTISSPAATENFRAFTAFNGPVCGIVASWYLQGEGGWLNIIFNMGINIINVYPFYNDYDGYRVLQHLGISEETINNHPTALGIPLIITTAASSALLVMLINKIAHISKKSVNWCINRTRKKSNIKTTENKRQLQGLKEITQLKAAYKNNTGIIQSRVLFS